MKNIKFIGIVLVSVVVILIGIMNARYKSTSIISFLWPPSKEEVVEKFYSNMDMFERSKNELINSQTDNFILEFENARLRVVAYDNHEKWKERPVDSSDLKTYKETIKLVQNRRIISAEINRKNQGQNIEYFIANFGQEIVWIEDMDYFNWGHSIGKIELIKDNWYYVKLN